MNRTTLPVIATAVLLTATLQAVAGGATKQEQPVYGQTSTDCSVVLPFEGNRPQIEDGSALLIRTANGVTAIVSMPTPATGTYCYPPATLATNSAAGPAVPGYPEVFTLWFIYFNNPAGCAPSGCGVPDVLGANCVNAQAGAMKLAGHVTGGGNLQLSGHASKGDGPLGALGCAAFTNIEGAEIHLAVAPHGVLQPSLMPALIQVPPGGGPGYWYPAVFGPIN